MAHNYGGEKSEGIFREHALFDFIVGDDLSLSLIPVPEYFAWPLDLKVYLPQLGGLVVVKPMRVLLPSLDE